MLSPEPTKLQNTSVISSTKSTNDISNLSTLSPNKNKYTKHLGQWESSGRSKQWHTNRAISRVSPLTNHVIPWTNHVRKLTNTHEPFLKYLGWKRAQSWFKSPLRWLPVTALCSYSDHLLALYTSNITPLITTWIDDNAPHTPTPHTGEGLSIYFASIISWTTPEGMCGTCW